MTSKNSSVGILLIYLTFLISFPAFSKTVFNFVGNEDRYDKRHLFIKDVLLLALNKTSEKSGDFELISSTSGENTARLFKQMDQNTYQNFFLKASITNEILVKYHVIEFPIDLGLAGYRIAFVPNDEKLIDCKKINLEDIKSKMTVQGIGWLDVDILKFNGFNVYAIAKYQQMFKMLEKNRVNFFFEVLMKYN